MKLLKSVSLKLLWVITGLLLGSVIIFLFSQYVPFDSIENKLVNQGISPDETENFNQEYERLYNTEKKNLPLFYLSVLPSNYHPNYRSILNKNERNKVKTIQKEGYIIDYSFVKDNYKITDKKPDFLVPTIHWHGSENQYHIYISNILKGEWGNSRKDDKNVISKIGGAINWTIVLIFFSLFITIPISFLLSFFLIKNTNSTFERSFLIFSSLQFAIPAFILATFVLLFFVSNQFGLQIFNSPLYLPIQNNSIAEILQHGLSKLAPAILCNVITDTVFLTYLLRNNMLSELNQPYILAARARGNNEHQIIVNHVFPNVLLPTVTLIINSLPIALAGSVVYELVFNIPGMGKLLYDAIYNADWNVVYGIVLLIMLITAIIYILGDIIYKIIDPRIK